MSFRLKYLYLWEGWKGALLWQCCLSGQIQSYTYVVNILKHAFHHHHHVPEGLGVFPVPWSSKWSWSLHLFFRRPVFLRPLVYIVMLVLAVYFCPSSVRVVATFSKHEYVRQSHSSFVLDPCSVSFMSYNFRSGIQYCYKHEFHIAILYTRTRIIRHKRDTTWGPRQMRNVIALHTYFI